MFETEAQLKKYVAENYPDVSHCWKNESHWDILCTKCRIVRGFQVVSFHVGETVHYGNYRRDFSAPVTYLYRCPVCGAFKHWIVYEFSVQVGSSGGQYRTRYYRVTSIPSEGLEEIDELPTEPPSLRVAYREAVRSMDANAPIASAVMFRRALQIILTHTLGANPKDNLIAQLASVAGKTHNGVMLTKNFADNAFIIRKAGNQGAHPDTDEDLLDFTAQDAQDLQLIFMEAVSELFIAPAAAEKAKQDFLNRRKIQLTKAQP